MTERVNVYSLISNYSRERSSPLYQYSRVRSFHPVTYQPILRNNEDISHPMRYPHPWPPTQSCHYPYFQSLPQIVYFPPTNKPVGEVNHDEWDRSHPSRWRRTCELLEPQDRYPLSFHAGLLQWSFQWRDQWYRKFVTTLSLQIHC